MSLMLDIVEQSRLLTAYQYDFFGAEWSYLCRTCGTNLYAPTKNDLKYNHWKHTHETCLGGW